MIVLATAHVTIHDRALMGATPAVVLETEAVQRELLGTAGQAESY